MKTIEKEGGQYRMNHECVVDILCNDCAANQECEYWEDAEDGDLCSV